MNKDFQFKFFLMHFSEYKTSDFNLNDGSLKTVVKGSGDAVVMQCWNLSKCT